MKQLSLQQHAKVNRFDILSWDSDFAGDEDALVSTPEIFDNIFGQSVSTKPAGDGRGPGLSLRNDLVHAHSGSIATESDRACETTFLEKVPCHDM